MRSATPLRTATLRTATLRTATLRTATNGLGGGNPDIRPRRGHAWLAVLGGELGSRRPGLPTVAATALRQPAITDG